MVVDGLRFAGDALLPGGTGQVVVGVAGTGRRFRTPGRNPVAIWLDYIKWGIGVRRLFVQPRSTKGGKL